MRLFLHGKSKPSMLMQKLATASSNNNNNNNNNYTYTSLLLSNWNLHEIPQDVLNALETFLIQQPIPDITLHNCNSTTDNINTTYDGDEEQKCQDLVVTLLHAVTSSASSEQSSLTIRYDKQRRFPLAIARGLFQAAAEQQQQQSSYCTLKALTLKGMTFTAETTSLLQQALSYIPTLQQLTIRGNFSLPELDKRGVSILGRHFTTNIDKQEEMECIVDLLYDTFQSLHDLKVLDLQQCHIPDEFLADLLEGVHPNTIQVLRLNGNMCMEESQRMLYEILSDKDCALEELDLSWQRMSQSKKNYSVLSLRLLNKALNKNNISLKKLNISDNKFLDQDVAELAVTLRRNESLQCLYMQNCRISSRAMLALAHTMPTWSETLTSVYLDGNQRVESSSSTRRKIYHALLENVYLRDLALPDTCKSKRIEWLLELNRAGRRVLLSPNELKNTGYSSSSSICSGSSSSFSTNESDFTNTSGDHPSVQDALWPTILERADRISRQEYLMEESSTNKAASAMFLLLREKGYQAIC